MPIIVPPVYVGAWLDENCVDRDTTQRRWPLHPKPYSYETLKSYVHRLAECYHVRYEHFCQNALGIPADDNQARQFQEPAPELLLRLSKGTGIPVEMLEQMTWPRIWNRLMEETRQYAATTKGQTELEGFSNKRLSQNS